MAGPTPNAPTPKGTPFKLPQSADTQQQAPAPMPMPNPNPFGRPKDDEEPDLFEVDLTGVSESGNVLIPEGQYPAVCVGVKYGYSKSGGNPQWIWRFAIANGPHAGVELNYYTALTPGALWKVTEVVTALGLGKAGEKVAFKKEQAINRRCLIEVFTDTYNGQKRSTIAQVLPHPEGPGPVTGPTAIQQAAAAKEPQPDIPF